MFILRASCAVSVCISASAIPQQAAQLYDLPRYSTDCVPFEFALGDFARDGLVDALVSSHPNTQVDGLRLLLGRPDGDFASATSNAAGVSTQSLDSADLDREGRLELIHGLHHKSRQTPTPVGDLGITLTIPAAFELSVNSSLREHDVAAWRGKLGDKRLELVVSVPPHASAREPTDVTERARFNLPRDPRRPHDETRWDSHQLIAGKFGFVPYASLATHAIRVEGRTDVATLVYYLGGLLETRGYLIVVAVSPAPNKDEDGLVRKFLAQGVGYSGPVREFRWTDEEARARWNDAVPGSDAKPRLLETILRTDHYVILTNSSGGKQFAKKMEECYAKIRAVYPFQDAPGQRLMPVFLFQMSDEYHDFFAKAFDAPLEQARKSKGVASRDFYATYYEAPNDPVHIHEATHQIFANRLHLWGGGSWFQEGVAEYIETSENERNEAARLVRDGRHMPLPEFMQVESLLFSPKTEDADPRGGNGASDLYKQAALIVEFVRESKFGKSKFLDWIHAIGSVERNDLAAIEAATRALYDVDIAGFEKEFSAYCKKR